MRTRFIIVLALIVISPLVIGGWLGARIVRDEQVLVEHRTRSLALAQLRAVADDVDEELRRHRDRTVSDVGVAAGSASVPIDRVGESPYVRQYFRIDPEGTMLHPALGSPNLLTDAQLAAGQTHFRDGECLEGPKSGEHVDLGAVVADHGAAIAHLAA